MSERILVLDGAMGTLLQDERLDEAAYRGDRLREHPVDLRGDNDLLSLTQPAAVARAHRAYLKAGADIIETNTFTASRINQAEYGLADLAREIHESAARIARAEADACERANPERPRYVAGSLGPTNRTASLSADVTDPGARSVTFAELADAYAEGAEGLIAGGADLLVVETIFDTLNAKAAIFGIEGLFERIGIRVPLMISGTVVDASGRTLSGQTVEAFWHSVRHARPLSVGLNCALGAREMRGWLDDLARIADLPITAYPNAGLPNAFGGYDETPDVTSGLLGEWARAGLVNMVGGCCGTTPQHVAAIADGRAWAAPPTGREVGAGPRLSGLEPLTVPQPGNLCSTSASARTSPAPGASRGSSRTSAMTRRCGRPRPGRERRGHARREHGRGAARLARGDEPFPAPRRVRARDRQGPDHDRQLELGRHRGGPAAGAGPARGQLVSLKEGEAEFLRQARLARRTARPSSSWPSTNRGRPARSSARWRSRNGP